MVSKVENRSNPMRQRKCRRRSDILRDLDAFRLLMSTQAYKYSDDELRQLQIEMKLMAEILVEYFYLRLEKEREKNSDDSGRGVSRGCE